MKHTTIKHPIIAGLAVLVTSHTVQGAEPTTGSNTPPAAKTNPAGQWRSAPPADCPFKPSASLTGIEFTGRHSDYRCGDTFYPSWASDGNLKTATAGNLVLNNNNAAKVLTINAGIVANSTSGLTVAGNVVLNGVNTYTGPTGIAGSLEIGSGSNQTLSGIISGDGSLVKSGAGTLTLSGASTYLGGTIIKNGAIVLTSTYRLSRAGTVTLNDAVAGTTGKLILGLTADTASRSQVFTGLYTDGPGGSVVGGGTSTSTAIYANIAGTDTFEGTLGGTGTNENILNLFKSGVGTMILSPPVANTHTGYSEVDYGTLLATKYTAISSSLALDKVWAAYGATLAVRALEASTNGEWTSDDLDLLLGGGGTTGSFASGSSLGIEVTGANTFTYANDIAGTSYDNGNRGKGLVKMGTGTLKLTGANTYTGNTDLLSFAKVM
jgi:fibronectin-binding autotransporter adhesin